MNQPRFFLRTQNFQRDAGLRFDLHPELIAVIGLAHRARRHRAHAFGTARAGSGNEPRDRIDSLDHRLR